jgi:hypothetical protein
MRVTADKLRWAGSPGWYGNAEANAISGVPRPHLLDARETPPVSAEIGSTWWRALRHSLELLATHRTSRVCVGAELLDHRIDAQLGVRIDFDQVVWSTAHGDLHWANLTAPDFWLLDWESWGTAPAGYDAALLHVVSLTRPPLARLIHRLHQRELDTPTDHIAQLAAASKVLELVDRGHNPELARPVRERAEQLLRDSTRAR